MVLPKLGVSATEGEEGRVVEGFASDGMAPAGRFTWGGWSFTEWFTWGGWSFTEFCLGGRAGLRVAGFTRGVGSEVGSGIRVMVGGITRVGGFGTGLGIRGVTELFSGGIAPIGYCCGESRMVGLTSL